MTKSRTCSIQTMSTQWLLFTLYIYHIAKYLKQNPPTQKCSSVEEQVAKWRWSTLLPFNFKENCLFCGEMCSLRPDLAIYQDGKSLFCAELQTGVKGKKVSKTSYCRYVIMYQWRLKFKFNFIWSSKYRFREINKKLMWFMDTMWKFVKKFQDSSHNSHWNLYVKVVKMNFIFFKENCIFVGQTKTSLKIWLK